MKKVLIIGYLWPYCRSEALNRSGSVRTIALAKYLSEFGWQPIIVTAPLREKPSNIRIIETSYRDIFYFWKKLLSLFGIKSDKSVSGKLKEKLGITSKKSFIDFLLNSYMAIFAYPDTEKEWKLFAIKSASNLLEKEKIEAIISFWPITAHLVAKELKNKYRIPWIADFSHLWSRGYYYQFGPIRKFIDKRLEIKTLLSANAITTVSQPLAENLRSLHKQKPVYPIIHGFDLAWLDISSTSLNSKFSITYTGNIYVGKEKPSRLFAVLKELIDDKLINRNDVEVLFYGGKYGWLEKETKKYGLADIVHQCGNVPHSISLQKQRESQILLHLGWDDEKIKGMYAAKVFEYLAAKRPILAVGGASDEVVRDLLFKTHGGKYGKTVGEIKNILRDFYSEYKMILRENSQF